MNHFATQKNILRAEANFVNCSSSKSFGDFKLFTYTVKLPTKKATEDDAYIKNPFLQKCLPRACSFVVFEDNVVDLIEGPAKFGGHSPIDEDESENGDSPNTTSIFDEKKVSQWAGKKELTVFGTEKANGKFAICKIMKHKDKLYLIFGSKNSHHILNVDALDEPANYYTDIVKTILADIKKHINILVSEPMLSCFLEGFSLAGELCDGQHFTPGDNSISWFGLFKDGISIPTDQSFSLLKSCGLKTVEYQILYDELSDPTTLNQVYLESRCKNSEGSVLRFQNNITKETILVKSKSAIYIVKRFLRTILTGKNRGYKAIDHLRTRFIDAQKYHNLNTNASIQLTRAMYGFAKWLNDQCYPGTVLGHQPVVGIRGILENGFSLYWEKYLESTNQPDLCLTYEDFGDFDEYEYMKETELYEKRLYCDPVLVVFLQNIQGSGKSTQANKICQKLEGAIYYEQDQFWGDTCACMSAIFHAVANADGPKIIVVSRCNVEPSQYNHYVSMLHHLPTQIIFIAPYEINELYLMISLSGIIKRSSETDNLLVGRKEYPISEVIDFTQNNYYNFTPHEKSYKIKMFENNEDLLIKSKEAIKNSTIQEFIQKNHEKLNSLRLDLDIIVNNIIQIICNPLPETFILMQNPLYIGMAITKADKILLQKIVDKYVPDEPKLNKTVLHHCTLVFIGKNNKLGDISTLILPGQKATVKICSLVIRKSDNACAFKIDSVKSNTHVVPRQTLHITARIPVNLQQLISNSFINLTDEKVVTIIPYNTTVEVTGFWN